jgi:hypothetical protein
MKRESFLALLSLALCASAQGGIVYTAFSPNGNIGPSITTAVESTATVTGYGSGLQVQSYTLTLTFANPNQVSYIGGSVTLIPLTGPPVQSFHVDDDFSTSDYIHYSDTFHTGSLIGVNPNTQWTLDLVNYGKGAGDVNTITGWSLGITAVPEPVNVALGIFAGLFVVGGLCRTQRVRNRIHRCRVGFNQWLDAV